MAISDVEGALFQAASDFLTANGIVASRIVWPNDNKDPAGMALWAKVSLMPGEVTPITLGDNGIDRGSGILQIDFSQPWGLETAISTFRSLEDAAYSAFPAGKSFSQSGQNVRVVRSEAGQVRKVDNWIRKSFTIRYRFEIQRPSI